MNEFNLISMEWLEDKGMIRRESSNYCNHSVCAMCGRYLCKTSFPNNDRYKEMFGDEYGFSTAYYYDHLLKEHEFECWVLENS